MIVSKLFPSLQSSLRCSIVGCGMGRNLFHTFALRCQLPTLKSIEAAGSRFCTPPSSPWSMDFVRTKIRCHFPRPKENKRIKTHGWLKRMSTLNGRRVIMNRILKGRHVLSH